MSQWLAAAEKLFRRPGNQPPPPFEVECACGRAVVGHRSAALQTPICPGCRAVLFVLPASVYPQPKAPKRKLVAAPKSQVEFVTLDEGGVDVETAPPAKTAKTARG